MILRASLLFLPVLLSAQAPPDVDQDLRARVNGFYQNFLDTSFAPRKGEPFVAEDTKDYYYNAAKEKYQSFHIEKINYSDNFTQATVIVVGKTTTSLGGQTVVVEFPKETHWKLENGKWCWTFHQEDYAVTPMGVGAKNPPTTGEAGGLKPPKDTSPAAIRTAGLSVLEQQPMGVDKGMFTVDPAAPWSQKVTFTNGADGEVQVGLDGPVVRGMKANIDKITVPGHGKATISFAYDPTDKSGAKDVWEPKGIIVFRVIAAPFNRIYPISLNFIGPR
jgi:hypothetical protein